MKLTDEQREQLREWIEGKRMYQPMDLREAIRLLLSSERAWSEEVKRRYEIMLIKLVSLECDLEQDELIPAQEIIDDIRSFVYRGFRSSLQEDKT